MVFTWCIVHGVARLLWEEAGTESCEFCSDEASRELLHSRIVFDFRMIWRLRCLNCQCRWIVLIVVLDL